MSAWAKRRCRGAGVLRAALVLVIAAGCYSVADPAPRSGLTNLLPDSTVVTADGASLLRVRAWVEPTLPLAQRVVTMNTTAGTFALGGKTSVTLTADSDGVATAYLQAPRDTCVAYVSASAGGPTGAPPLTLSIVYRRAQPDAIDVVADSFFLTEGIKNSLKVTAHLRRTVGRPSPFLSVEFRAMPPGSEDSLGRFTTALPSDSSGQVTVEWTIADTLHYGDVIIRAQVRHNGTTVTGRTRITVIRPDSPNKQTPARQSRSVRGERTT